jgi:hypothetical protein
MTISEKIDNSANHTRFTLYKEGLFYKCYNEDAMVFVKNVKDYKGSEKFVKSVGAAVYSIGFPLFGLLACASRTADKNRFNTRSLGNSH